MVMSAAAPAAFRFSGLLVVDSGATTWLAAAASGHHKDAFLNPSPATV
jgi:hypothetical protein